MKKHDSEGGVYSFSISKTMVGAINFVPWGMARWLSAFGLCYFLSLYCTNSPKIHINISLSGAEFYDLYGSPPTRDTL